MMGTLATVLAGKKIRTPEESFRAEVEGDIENVEWDSQDNPRFE